MSLIETEHGTDSPVPPARRRKYAGRELDARRLKPDLLVAVLLLWPIATGSALAQNKSPANSPMARAPAQTSPGGTTKEQERVIGDWRLRCTTEGGAPLTRRTCEIIQFVTVPNQAAPFAEIAFGKPTAKDPLLVTVVVPVNIAFPSSLRVAIDEKDPQPVELSWRRCLPAGCFANLAPDELLLKRWRALQTRGRVTFKNAAGQDVLIPISFRGLAGALDALAKEQ